MNEQKKIEELLKPRFEVIAGYPESKFEVGQILAPLGLEMKLGLADEWATHFKKYPAIFKPLQWWEKRSVEEMPDYVFYQFMPDSLIKCLKVTSHFTDSKGKKNAMGFVSGMEFYSYSKTKPAIESEYNNYINSKKQ